MKDGQKRDIRILCKSCRKQFYATKIIEILNVACCPYCKKRIGKVMS